MSEKKPIDEVIHLKPSDLPAHCPSDNTLLWCEHPKVFVALEVDGVHDWTCPYCGAHFVLDRD